ncbi:MAG: SGNH/GDSL hydrolase family protein [Verrucomicrobia bacterium]|nr:SGNH/GDSL hydrolase family protein [Verrucomicrobiota bacterium]MDA1087091.1 SGNH/GDSL hydrolase family protein [Verrucomicrobiota bacterium]
MKIAPGHTFVLIGDSITDAGRDMTGEDTPWSPGTGFGSGYVNLLNALILSETPGAAVRMINRGLDGNTVRDLKARWRTDVLDLNPDWLSVGIGVNDVWRQFDSPLRKDIHVYAEEYEKTYDDLLERTRSQLEGLILISPFVLEPYREDPMRATMDRYGRIVEALAKKHDAHFVDAQAELDKLMLHIPAGALAWDRIHINSVGHMALAKALYQIIA